MAPPGALDVSIRRRDHVIELSLAGDLDLATAHRLREAMAWLRFTQERRSGVGLGGGSYVNLLNRNLRAIGEDLGAGLQQF